jgi:hypothetical protein
MEVVPEGDRFDRHAAAGNQRRASRFFRGDFSHVFTPFDLSDTNRSIEVSWRGMKWLCRNFINHNTTKKKKQLWVDSSTNGRY